MLLSLRQLLYPKEFRISSPRWPASSMALEDIVILLKHGSSEIEADSGQEKDLLSIVVDTGTVIWRLQRRLQEGSKAPKDIKRISRDLESTWDALKQGGVEIRDHTGEKYDGGMALRVIAFQPMPELSQEQVLETIKPTIYHKDQIVQMGEVIVGVPMKDTKPNTTERM